MTHDLRFERLSRDWLELGPVEAPADVLQAAFREIATTSQERDLRVPWRFPAMTRFVLVATAVALVALLGIGAFIAGSKPPPLPTPPSANVATPSPTALPSVAGSPAAVTIASYRAARDAVCTAITQASIPDPDPSAGPDAVIAFLQATIARGNDEIRQLQALQAPPALEAEHIANVQTTRDVYALLEHELELVQQGKTGQANAVDEATIALNDLREQYAFKYSLADCP
jgi:hypothetical protein